MFKICNICFKTDTRGNKMISIEMSTLDRIAEHRVGHVHASVQPVGPDLQPTNYCTSIWNGVRCLGDHYPGATWHAGGQLDNGGYLRMWQDGQDGVDMTGPAELWNFNDLDFELGWSALDQMHAEARDGEGPVVTLDDGWTPFDADGNLCDLESEGWHVLGAMTDDQSISFASECAGICVRGLMETFVDADHRAWLGTLLNV